MKRDGSNIPHYDGVLDILREQHVDLDALPVRVMIEVCEPLGGSTPERTASVICHALLSWFGEKQDFAPPNHDLNDFIELAQTTVSKLSAREGYNGRGGNDQIFYPNVIPVKNT